MTSAVRLAFGGPDLPPRALRDLLQAAVDAAPPGSRIDWATYYFRDRALADALIRASHRGVRVRLALEDEPRREGTNDAVAAMLARHGLGGGFHLRRGGPGSVHAKIYAFSEPRIAWVGTFNPSGDEPEDPAVVAEIGDQDRGHNLLVGLTDPVLVDALAAHAVRLGRRRTLLDRFRPSFNAAVGSGGVRLFFYPRLRTRLVERDIDRLGPGGRVLGAVSHFKRGPLSAALLAASRRGAAVRLLVHDTERRVPGRLVRELGERGVAIERVGDDAHPMHAKFLLLERNAGPVLWTGSFNHNPRSRWLNDELLVRIEDAYAAAAVRARYGALGPAR